MANNTAAPPPVDTPFFTIKGRISDIWRLWLNSITTAANSAAGALLAVNNLSDLLSPAAARNNLGLGSAATRNTSDFDAAGAAAAALSAAEASSLQVANNLSDLADAPAARTNLGLGSAATHASTDFDAAGSAAAAQAAAEAASDPAGSAATVQAASLQKASNLSDVATRQTALNNLTGTQTAGKYLRSDGTNAALASIQAADVPTLNQSTTGNAATATTATNLAAGALGSLPYQSAAGATALLAGNATTTKKFLSQTGTGTVSAAPAWNALASADITGALGYTPLNPANNLSDLASSATALTNLIGSWANWTPTVTGGGTMTASGASVTDAQYVRVGPLVFFKLQLSVTLGGTASSFFTVTTPVATVGNQSAVTLNIQQAGAGGYSPGIGYVLNSTSFAIQLAGQGSFPLGSTAIWVEGFYRCA